jgi:hypothetical protein
MLDAATSYTLLVMAGFSLVALIVVHHHHCSDAVRRRRGEVTATERQLDERTRALQQQIDQLAEKILVVDEQMTAWEK